MRFVDLGNMENNRFTVTSDFIVGGLKGVIKASTASLVTGICLVLIKCRILRRGESSGLMSTGRLKGVRSKLQIL